MAASLLGSSDDNVDELCNGKEDKDFFQNWLSGKLQHHNADEEVFLPYIMSILEDAECSSPQCDEDVLDSLSDILEGLGIDENSDNQGMGWINYNDLTKYIKLISNRESCVW